jgi:1-acyl-sn-glycerol-3-phosphate acyltransferase
MWIAPEASVFYRLLQRIGWWLLRNLSHLDISGLENVPARGPVIIAPNHLHMLDVVVVGIVIPRRQIVFAADKWRGTMGGCLMQIIANAIFVARGEPDRRALNKAMRVLQAGGALAIAPEGTRSRTGGLLRGKNGTAYLASRTSAAIVPVAVWGQEKALGSWVRLRRPPIHVRVGQPIHLPPQSRDARGEELRVYTDQIMLAIARMLPPQYRGVYAEQVAAEEEGPARGSTV